MRKYLLFLALGTFVLTGCGEKTLTCTNSETSDEYSIDEEIVLKFDKDGEKIKSGSFAAEFKVSEDYIERIDELIEYTETSFEDLKEKGIDYKIQEKNDGFSLTLNYNTKNLTEEQIDELYFSGMYFEDDYNTVKTDYEEQGYTCK